MRSLFEYNSGREPFLAPLGPRRVLPSLSPRRLPSAAAPLAVTVVGGLALVVVLGWFLSHGASGKPTPAQQAFSDMPVPVQEAVQDSAPGSAPAAVPEETASMTQAAPEPAARDAGMRVEEEMGAAEDRGPAPVRPFEAAAAGADADPALPVHALSPVAEAATGQLADPEATTAAIPRSLPVTDSAAPDVSVAETEAEIEALEALQRLEMGPDLSAAGGAAGEPSNEETAAIAPQPAAQMRAATTTQHVNLRAGPDGDTEVLTIVPGRAAIEAEADCGWCAVRYDGRTGYLYRSFIRYSD